MFVHKNNTLILSIIVLILCTALTMSFSEKTTYARPDTITYTKDSSHTVTEYVEIDVPTFVPIEKPQKIINVIEPVYIEKPVKVTHEVPIELTDWESAEELQAFLEADDTDRRISLTTDNTGLVKFSGQCEDYALQLRDGAMTIGRHLSIQVLHPEEFKKWYPNSKESAYHAICLARIGNEFWYIEPSTDECWLALYLD